MKQSLQLKIGQQLAMTPQLQQAIRLLQLSSLDLQQEVQEALESNFMLEVEDSNDPQEHSDEGENTPQETEALIQAVDTALAQDDAAAESSGTIAKEEQQVDFQESQTDIPEELPTDSQWDEIFDTPVIHASTTPSSHAFNNQDNDFLEQTQSETQNIRDYLREQINLMRLSDEDTEIAEVIIDSIDDSGYLTAEISELLSNFDEQSEIGEAELMAVLHMIQQLEPAGVGARNIQESLQIQLNQLPEDTPWLAEAKHLVKRYLHLLSSRDFNHLKRRMKLSEEEMIAVIKLIQSLNPRPAGQISTEKTQYIVPDIIVKKVNGVWRAELNPDLIPNLTINQHYLQLSKTVRNEADISSMKEHIQEARWFIKSIQSRHETLLKVARCILEFQQDYFNYGEEYMKALVLADVAKKVDMHESTISRVTTQKYMHTPKGIFELKYFFSSHVSTASGGEASATVIRAIIKKLIESENKRKPYSDNKLSQLLAQQNYKVARRTVAKYRESLSIPPSNERKTLA